MGGGISTSLSDDNKILLKNCLQDKLDEIKTNYERKFSDIEVFEILNKLYCEKISQMNEKIEIPHHSSKVISFESPTIESNNHSLSPSNQDTRMRRRSMSFKRHSDAFSTADFELHSGTVVLKKDETIPVRIDEKHYEKVEAYTALLKSGAIPTVVSSEFRSRRLTYGQKTIHDPEPTMHERRKSTRLHIYASTEVGMTASIRPPFSFETVGTFSCHGIEPVPNESGHTREKINQDRGCVVYPFQTVAAAGHSLFLVLDGHGEQGDLVAEFVMKQIVLNLDHHSLLITDPKLALEESILNSHKALTNTHINSMTSGCTCVGIYMLGSKIYIVNVGDSRAVLARQKSFITNTLPEYIVEQLTIDHKPDVPAEMDRIIAYGGYVRPGRCGGPSRVYLDEDLTMIGLATSRTIGDSIVKDVGVTAKPDITEYVIQPDDSFIILASDGVWEFISSQEAVDIVGTFIDEGATIACQELIAAAMMKWESAEGDYRDDITAIVVTLPVTEPI